MLPTLWDFPTLPGKGWCCAISHQTMGATEMFMERSQEDGFGWDSFGGNIMSETRTEWGE